MSATATAPQLAPPAEASLSQLGRSLRTWFRKNIPAVIVSAAVGIVVGFITNIWIGAVFYQGTNGATAAGHGAATAAMLSGVATTVVFGVYGYYRAVGPTKFAADIRGLPAALLTLGTREGTPGWVHLLWGAATTMVATAVISPGVGAILAIGLLASAPGYLGRVLSTLIMRIWSQVLQRVAPTRKAHPPGVLSMSVGVIGGSVAMLAGYLIPAASVTGPLPTRLVVAVGCGVGAVVIGQRGPGTPVAGAALKLLLLAVGGLVLAETLHPLAAWATDGGSAECGNLAWSKYLTQCQGASGVAALATAGAVAGGVAAPVGYGLGNAAGSDDGGTPGPNDRGDHGDGGANVGSGPMHPPPPPPHFPHVFMRGGQVVIECANGVILSATPNPDGTLGPWSAQNLHTQSGGQVDTRITNDDGSTTTHYTDGTVTTSGGPDGSVQTWGPDNSYTNAGADGVVTTTHGDGSVDVRNPDGTVTTTLPNNGGQTINSPDGTVVKVNADGTFTYNRDGTVDATLANGDKVHQSTDGTTVSTDPNGVQTVTNNDGTVTITRPDGSSETKWPDGSSEVVAPDGTKTITQRDGTTYIHNPDGSVQTNNPDGSDRTRSADGSITQTGPDGVQTTWNKDGSVDIMHPNGTLVTHNTDGSVDTIYADGTTVTHNSGGTMSAMGPDGKDLGDPNSILRNLDAQSGYMSKDHPEVFQAVADLQKQVAANGGVWTPAELATLMAIQGRADLGTAQRHDEVVASQNAFADAGMDAMVKRLENEKRIEKIDADNRTQMFNQSQYIRSHLDDFPTSKWKDVEDTLTKLNSKGPNSDDLNKLKVISRAMFADGRTDGAQGKYLGNAIRIANADPPGPPPGTDLPSLVGAQQDFLSNHLHLLPPAQQEVVRRLIDKSYANPTVKDLQDLQRASHAAFNTMQGGSEAAGAQAQIDALDAEGRMVAVQRVNQAAQAVSLGMALPIMATGAAGMIGMGKIAGTILGPITIPGAAAAMGSVAAVNFTAQGLTGAINGYYEPGTAGGMSGAAFGAAKATLPINTINAVMHGDGAGTIALSVVQDTGNVLGGIAAGKQVVGWGIAANPGGTLDKLFGEKPLPMTPENAKFLASRTDAGRNIADLRDAQLRSFDDPNFMKASQNLANAEGRLALNAADAAAQAEVKAARAVLDANSSQQQLENTTRKMLDDYQSRNLLKQTPPELQQAYIDQVKAINARVDDRFVQSLNDAGYMRGGKPFTQADLVDLRNATSTTAPMDRDLALNQMRERELAAFIKNPPPSADQDQIQRLSQRLQQIRSDSALTLNGKPISAGDWQVDAQHIYGQEFTQVTGKNPDLALQTITTSTHIEAYPDLNVLRNDPKNYPFDPLHAEATGDVTTAKAADAEHVLGKSNPWDAQQEIARGTAKDIDTKLTPLLQAKGADATAIAQAQDTANFLRDVGNGKYPPSEAQRLTQLYFGPGATLGTVNAQVGAGIATATKFVAPGPSVADQFDKGIRTTLKLVNTAVKIDKMETLHQTNKNSESNK